MKDRDALWHQDPVQGRLKVGVMAGEREGGPGAAWVLPSGEQAEGPAQEGGGMSCNTHSGTCGRWPL